VSERHAAREPASEITREGAIAAKTLVAVLVVTGVASIAASWGELWRPCGATGPCVVRASTAALIAVFAVAAIGVGVGLGLRLRRRPVGPEGSSLYVISLGVLFALGLMLVAAKVPAWTCSRGRFDPYLETCLHPPTASDATSWLLWKRMILLAGLAGGVAIAFSRRWVKMSAPLAALAWFGGAGWLLVATEVMHRT
jgi:hypothetical protein